MLKPPTGRRLGILCNTRSGRCRRRLAEIRRQAARCRQFDYREVEDSESINAALDDFIADEVAIIVVMGGDGTLQAALTALLTTQAVAPEALPALIAIAGGTTNMSARSMGARLSPWAALAHLTAWCEGHRGGPRAASRPVLQITVGSAPAQYGLFFGAGAITTGVAYFHAQVHSRLAGAWGPRLAFMRMLSAILRSKPHPLLPPTHCRLKFDDGTLMSGDYQIVAISTLDRLLLGTRPFWGTQPGALRLAAMAREAASPWRRLPPLLYGRGASSVSGKDGYFSRNLTALTLECESDFILDGERFAAGNGQPVRVAASVALPFYVL